jgi:hypothetical protein
MKHLNILVLAVPCCLAFIVCAQLFAADAQRPIDPVRGRTLMQKASRGEKLTEGGAVIS